MIFHFNYFYYCNGAASDNGRGEGNKQMEKTHKTTLLRAHDIPATVWDSSMVEQLPFPQTMCS